MIGRVLAMAIGLFSGLAASQTPEFAQQYRQRLGGAIDELRRVVERFDGDARATGLTRQQAIARLEASPDPLVRKQADAVEDDLGRLGRLERQRQAFLDAGPFERLLVLLREHDPGIARAAYLDYEPAWPATTEGLATGAAGFALGWGLVLFLSRALRRLSPWRRRTGGLRAA